MIALDLAAAVRLEQARRGRARLRNTSLLDFVPAVSPAYEAPAHLEALVNALENCEQTAVRACYSVPPRHGKTETILHAIARLLLRHPDWLIGYVSYSAALARSKSRQLRDMAVSIGVELAHGSRSLGEWRTVQGGGVLATGVGGPLTGHGLQVLVVDDPYKNRQDADSALIRQRTHAWFTSTALTRVEPGGSVLVVHTRWHRDDLIGRLAIDTEAEWSVHTMPALSIDGRALWPSRWPVAALARRRAEVSDYDWDSLYQQNPTVRAGLVFPDFSSVHVVPHAVLEARYRPSGTWSLQSRGCGVDWGWSDPSAWIVGGRTGDGTVVIVDELYESNVLVDAQGWLGRARALRDQYGLEWFAGDPSAPHNLAALRGYLGGRPVVYSAENAIAWGLGKIATALRVQQRGAVVSPGLLISDRCKNLIRELGEYSYRAGPTGPSEVPEDKNNHAVDALRYLIQRLQ